jgi:hypothetical protein
MSDQDLAGIVALRAWLKEVKSSRLSHFFDDRFISGVEFALDVVTKERKKRGDPGRRVGGSDEA